MRCSNSCFLFSCLGEADSTYIHSKDWTVWKKLAHRTGISLVYLNTFDFPVVAFSSALWYLRENVIVDLVVTAIIFSDCWSGSGLSKRDWYEMVCTGAERLLFREWSQRQWPCMLVFPWLNMSRQIVPVYSQDTVTFKLESHDNYPITTTTTTNKNAQKYILN